MNKVIIAILAAVIVSFLPSSETNAHVFVKDAIGTAGVVMHIVPDDDPVAGEEANLFFDLQASNIPKKYTAILSIQHEQKIIKVETKIEGSSMSAKYVFPEQGVYQIKLVISSNDVRDVEFNHTQRVTRGITNGASENVRYVWAEMTIIFSVCLLIIVGILFVNQRREIAKQSVL